MENPLHELPIYLTILSPVFSFLGAIWFSGYRVGKMKTEFDITLITFKKAVEDSAVTTEVAISEIKSDVKSLSLEVDNLADCITLDGVRKEGYVTKEELLNGQSLCKQLQDHRSEMILKQYEQLNESFNEHGEVLKSFTTEIRTIREAMIKKGII